MKHFRKSWGALFVCLVCLSCVASVCTENPYRGFDQRLKASILGRLPRETQNKPIYAFEVANRTQLVLYRDELVALRNGHRKRLNVPVRSGMTVTAMMIDHGGTPILEFNSLNQTDRRTFKRLRESGLVVDQKLSETAQGHLFNSGNRVFIERNGSALIARSQTGAALNIVTVNPPMRILSWNQLGLAGISDQHLLIWPSGAKELTELAQDSGFREARDVCLVGDHAAVVTLQNYVLLITGSTRIPIVAMKARCRWQGDTLYLLDEESGLIWAVRGLANVGDLVQDRTFAFSLIEKRKTERGQNNQDILQAARILGCDEVDKFLRIDGARNESSAYSQSTANGSVHRSLNLANTEPVTIVIELREADSYFTQAACDASAPAFSERLRAGETKVVSCNDRNGFCIRWRFVNGPAGDWKAISCKGDGGKWDSGQRNLNF